MDSDEGYTLRLTVIRIRRGNRGRDRLDTRGERERERLPVIAG